jgi:surface protein
LSSFNAANVTDMSHMFYRCMALKSLDLSTFKTANVTNMHAMFRECEALESLDLSSFNTANVTNMNNMFRQCKALKSLDIHTFDIGKVTDFTFIFNFVGYNAGTGSKTPIKVTSALHTALKDKDVSPGDYAEYFIVDNLPS